MKTKNSLFIVESLNDINYMQFSEAYCGTTVSLADIRETGSFRAIILSLIYILSLGPH